MVVMALPAVILAQPMTSQYQGPNYASQPYTPAVPPPSMTTSYGGYGGSFGGGSTAAGSAMTGAGNAMNGLGNAMAGAGSMHLSNSAAAINMTQAQKNEIQNHQLGEQTYFAMRSENRAAVAAERGPKPTKEQLARIAKEGIPKPLSPSMMDPTTGRIEWPPMLQSDRYDAQRTALSEIFAKTVRYGAMDYSDQMKARQAIETMFATMKTQIRDVPVSDYMGSRDFLASLKYYTCKNWLD